MQSERTMLSWFKILSSALPTALWPRHTPTCGAPVERGVALRNVQWGTGCVVYEPCNIYNCVIGNNVRIGPFTEIQDLCCIGDGTVISSHSFISGGTKIGRNVFIGHAVVTCNDKYPIPNNSEWQSVPPSIGDGASVGSGAIVLPGIHIGENAVIGAGVTVLSDVPAGTVYVGKRSEPTRAVRHGCQADPQRNKFVVLGP